MLMFLEEYGEAYSRCYDLSVIGGILFTLVSTAVSNRHRNRWEYDTWPRSLFVLIHDWLSVTLVYVVCCLIVFWWMHAFVVVCARACVFIFSLVLVFRCVRAHKP